MSKSQLLSSSETPIEGVKRPVRKGRWLEKEHNKHNQSKKCTFKNFASFTSLNFNRSAAFLNRDFDLLNFTLFLKFV